MKSLLDISDIQSSSRLLLFYSPLFPSPKFIRIDLISYCRTVGPQISHEHKYQKNLITRCGLKDSNTYVFIFGQENCAYA